MYSFFIKINLLKYRGLSGWDHPDYFHEYVCIETNILFFCVADMIM